jgi:choline-sulfatase
LDDLGLLGNTVIIILSDHGEEFWDHSEVFSDHPHGSVYNELLHVPFMIYVPDFRQSQSASIEDEVSTVDLVPTVGDLLDIPVPAHVDGVSLRPLMEGETISRTIPIIGMTWPEHRGDIHISPDECRVFVVSDGMKYIEQLDVRADVLGAGEPLPSFRINEEMYELTDDPHETNNRSAELLEESAEMRELLRNALDQAGRRIPEAHDDTLTVSMPLDLVRQLTVLGYIDGE